MEKQKYLQLKPTNKKATFSLGTPAQANTQAPKGSHEAHIGNTSIGAQSPMWNIHVHPHTT